MKTYIFLLFILLSFSGCVEKIETIKAPDNLENNLAQGEQNILNALESKLQTNQLQNEQTSQKLLDKCYERQNTLFLKLSDDIKTLKLENINSLKTTLNKEEKPKEVVIKELKGYKNKIVVGEVEKVKIYPSDFVMDARIDTGAEVSSIDARDIEEFERDGKKWVRFTLINRENKKEEVIERELKKVTKITQSSNKDGVDKRLTVSLKIDIANRSELADFTLTDREHMSFGVLIGRNILKDIMLVDVSGKFLAPLEK